LGTSEIPLDIGTRKYIIIFTPHRCAVFVPQKFFETYFARPLDTEAEKFIITDSARKCGFKFFDNRK